MNAENGYNYFLNLAIAVDQLANSILGGACDETFSSRCYRRGLTSVYWKIVQVLVDLLLFFDHNHCETSFLAETDRKQSPPEERT